MPTPDAPPLPATKRLLPYNERDVEAVARMLASENPRGSRKLHIEQIYTQVRQALRKKQSLYDRITGGAGYGIQLRPRPVSTADEARPEDRKLAIEVLEGEHPSTLPNARKFFEPAVQDAVLPLAIEARKKRARGEALTKRETRLLGYEKSAEDVRKEWRQDGTVPVGTIEGVEFWT